MQDRYTGDVGDFGKYGLLKALCQGAANAVGPALSLGVAWYLTCPEEMTADGKHVTYLEPTPHNRAYFRNCDPPLYDGLAQIVAGEERRVAAVRRRGILPEKTVFFEELLSFAGLPPVGARAREVRLAHRDGWVRGALEATRDRDVVFADPDNGLEVSSVGLQHKKGPKYAFVQELELYYRRGQSVIVYQHMDHSAPAPRQLDARLDQLSRGLRTAGVFGLLYHRGTSRAFLVAPAGRHQGVLARRAERFLDGPWGRHFSGPYARH